MSVKQTHAEGTRERQAVTFPGPTAAALALPVLVAMGGQEPTSSGKATFRCVFRSWVVARVNLVFYQPGLGRCPRHTAARTISHRGTAGTFSIPHTSQTSQAAEACGPPPSPPSWGEIRCPLPRPTLLTTPASCSPAEAPPWGPERPDLLLHTWVPLRNTPEDCGRLTFAGAPRGSGQ